MYNMATHTNTGARLHRFAHTQARRTAVKMKFNKQCGAQTYQTYTLNSGRSTASLK